MYNQAFTELYRMVTGQNRAWVFCHCDIHINLGDLEDQLMGDFLFGAATWDDDMHTPSTEEHDIPPFFEGYRDTEAQKN